LCQKHHHIYYPPQQFPLIRKKGIDIIRTRK
jgi:hypothetical protein